MTVANPESLVVAGHQLLIDALSFSDRGQHMDLLNAGRGDLERIGIEYDPVGELFGFERTFL